MTNSIINVEARENSGKGAARQLRREEKIPAVIYGAGKPATTIALTQHELLIAMNRGGFMSHVHDIQINGKTEAKVLTRDIQRNPVSYKVEHVDFLRFDPKKKINVNVPVRIIGEDESEGVKMGGVVSLMRAEIELVCSPASIPEFLEVSVADLGIGEAVHASTMTLPADCEFAIDDRDFTVANILTTKSLAQEDEEAAAAAEAEEGVEGEEGAEATEGAEGDAKETTEEKASE